jgi:hypothetical protein
MKRLFCAKPLVATVIALGAVAAASVAHARSDVVFSIGVNAPGGYVVPAPVYVQPQPVYVQPQPVYVQPQPIYVQPRAYYGGGYYAQRSGPHGDWDRDGVANRFDRDSRWFDPRAAYHYGGRRDADHDGVPNRADRAPHNPYRY